MSCAARGRGSRARLGPRARPEDELHALMSSIIDWAISFLSETNQASIRAVYYEGKTVREHSVDEVVIVYKRLDRSYPVMREIIGEEIEALDPDAPAPSWWRCSASVAVMRRVVDQAKGAAATGQPKPARVYGEVAGKRIEVSVSYAGELGLVEAVSRYLAV